MCAAFAEENVYWSDTPVTCHWIGAVKRSSTSSSDYNAGYLPMPQMDYAQWTNKNNWAEGIVPGRIAVPQADGTVVTNGSLGSTAVFDGNCRISCIELYGFVSISNILVTGATAPRFYFGHWRWDNPYLGIEQGGSFRVTADVPQAPYVIPHLLFSNLTRSGETVTFRNDSAVELSLLGIVKVDPQATVWRALTYRWEGTGDIRRRQRNFTSNWCALYLMAMTGGKYIVSCPESNAENIQNLMSEDTGFVQTIEITANHMMAIEEALGAIRADGSMDICGEGTLVLRTTSSLYPPTLYIGDGKTLDISAKITRTSSAPADKSGITVGSGGYSGLLRLSGRNTFPGTLLVQNGATLEVPAFGLGNAGCPVGMSGVSLTGRSVLRYTGNGETTDRTLSGAGFGTVVMAGTGDLVWKGEIGGGTTYSYTITNESPTARFVCATSTVAKSLQLVAGSRLGFAKPDDSDAIAMHKLVMDGDASVDVGDGVTVTLAEFSRTTGTLAVTLTGSGKLIFPGVSEGLAPDWITVNGRTAWYGADGSVYTPDALANSHTIAAHGDTVPDAPGEAVGITTEGTGGNDTLAATTTRVRVLNQEVAVPATVDMSAGQTLQANLIRVKSGAGDLTVGTTAGVGSVTVAEGSFTVQADDASASLTVNAALSLPGATPVYAYGAGTNVFAAWNGYAGTLSMTGGTVLITNTVNVTAATLRGTGTFDFSRGEMALTASDTDGVYAEYSATGSVNLGATGGKLKMSGAQNLEVGVLEIGNGGELVLDGPALTASGVSVGMDGATQPAQSIVVGTNGTGVLRLMDGAVTGRLAVAIYDSATVRGAVYQTGGEVANVTKNGETSVIGVHGYAYYGLYGGRYVAAGDWYLGSNGEGVFDMTGGELWHTPTTMHKSRFRCGGTGANAVMRISGGTFNATNVTDITIMPGYNRSGTSAELTVENGGKFLQPDNQAIVIGMGYDSKPCHAIVNINSGGTIRSPGIFRYSSYAYPTEDWPEGTSSTKNFTNMYACVNCSGGKFVNDNWGNPFGARNSQWAYPPHRITLFEGGLEFDTNGKNCSIAAGGTFQAPSGQGVTSIPWNAAVDGQGYVGSPVVRIEGDGKGATAWADFDHETGTVTGIRVTSPGNDYTYANALVIMNKKTIKTIPCTLGVVPSGGLTKSGSGTLTLNATNTYTGATTVRKGTLTLGYDDVISSASELVLDGGTLDMNGKAQTFSNIRSTANGGSVINGTPALSGLAIDFDDVLAGNVYSIGSPVAFAAGAKLTLANADKAARPPNRYVLATFSGDLDASNLSVAEETIDALPPRWQISFEGRRIMLRYPIGAVMSFR